MKSFDRQQFISEFVKANPTPFISRLAAREKTGGAVGGKTLANLDSQGCGPQGAFSLGKHVCYPTLLFAEWLADRVSMIKRGRVGSPRC